MKNTVLGVPIACAAALALSCATAAAGGSAATAASGRSAEKLRALGDRYWRTLLATTTLPTLLQGGIGTLGGPLYATSIGVHDFDAALDDLSAPAREKLLADLRQIAADLKALPSADLKDDDALSAQILAYQLDDAQTAEVCKSQLWSLDPSNGPWAQVAQTPLGYLLDGADSARTLEARLTQVPRYFDQVEANLAAGLAAGLVAARADVARALDQLDNLTAGDLESSPLLPAADRFAKVPEGAAARERLRALLATKVIPAAQKLRKFIAARVLPAARSDEQIGLWALPNGADCYAFLVRQHTGSSRAPQELHELGLRELGKIEAEAQAVALEAGAQRESDGRVNLKAFRAHLQHEPDQFKRTPDELLAYNRDLLARATAALPRAFTDLKLKPIEVRPFEAYRAPAMPVGFYQPAPDDGSQPGVFYVNTYKPETRALYNTEALLFHEAVPGHHLEGSITQQRAAPDYRRQLGPTAYVEGWALYSERMADEQLHLYSGPAARFGMLGYQAWRASRLVVDTGMHALHWDREKCVRFLTDHTTLPRNEAETEIDRYASTPAQALGYMVGELEIYRLRRDAEAKLGPNFDLRGFHQALLEHGPVPLQALSALIDQWISRQQAAGAR